METCNSQTEISYSDNSHFFGRPLLLKWNEYVSGELVIPRKELKEWIERTLPLGLDIDFIFEGS